MNKPKRRFTKEQLMFAAELIVSAAIDRIDSALPNLTENGINKDDLADWKKNKNSRLCYIDGAMQTAGMGLAVLYAQLMDDGLGVGDAIEAAKLDKVVEIFIKARTSGTAKLTPKGNPAAGWRDPTYPDIYTVAKRFVEKMFFDDSGPYNAAK